MTRCEHNRNAICWLCAPEGEGPAWWSEVEGYGSRRPSRLARIRWLVAAVTKEEWAKLPPDAAARAKAYQRLLK